MGVKLFQERGVNEQCKSLRYASEFQNMCAVVCKLSKRRQPLARRNDPLIQSGLVCLLINTAARMLVRIHIYFLFCLPRVTRILPLTQFFCRCLASSIILSILLIYRHAENVEREMQHESA